MQGKCHKIKLQYKLSFIMFLHLAPSALSWPGRGTLGNPFPSLTKSISVGSLTSRQILCSMQQPIIVEDTVSSDSSSLFSRHLHLPFNSPNACSTTTIIIIIIIIITLIVTSSWGFSGTIYKLFTIYKNKNGNKNSKSQFMMVFY